MRLEMVVSLLSTGWLVGFWQRRESSYQVLVLDFNMLVSVLHFLLLLELMWNLIQAILEYFKLLGENTVCTIWYFFNLAKIIQWEDTESKLKSVFSPRERSQNQKMQKSKRSNAKEQQCTAFLDLLLHCEIVLVCIFFPAPSRGKKIG